MLSASFAEARRAAGIATTLLAPIVLMPISLPTPRARAGLSRPLAVEAAPEQNEPAQSVCHPSGLTREVLAARKGIAHKDIKGEREAELVRRYQAGDRHAGEILLRAHAALIASTTKPYRHSRWHDLAPEDLMAEAQIGFLEGVKRFDPTVGVRLSTYALHWARRRAHRATADEGTTIRVPVHHHEGGKKGQKKHSNEARAALGVLRLDAPTGDEDDRTFADLAVDGAPLADERLCAEEEREMVESILSRAGLTPRERTVLERRVLTDEPETLAEIGLSFGLTRESIRKIEAGALEKIRRAHRKETREPAARGYPLRFLSGPASTR